MAKDDPLTVRLGVRNIKLGEFAQILASIPERVKPAAILAAGQYLVEQFRKYPPYKYVSRKAAYGGDGFFSDKQRRFVMASLRAGRNLKTGAPMEPGYPHRTGNIQRGWVLEGKDAKLTTIKNVHPAAGYLFSDTMQARQVGLVGWQTITDLTEANIDKAGEAAIEAASAETLELLEKGGKPMKAQKAQGLVEYSLVLVLVAVVVIAALTIMGPLIANVFSTINQSLVIPAQ